MSLFKIHCNYLHKFGIERLKRYYTFLGNFCLNKRIEFPNLKETKLEDFLEENNLWYTLYLTCY